MLRLWPSGSFGHLGAARAGGVLHLGEWRLKIVSVQTLARLQIGRSCPSPGFCWLPITCFLHLRGSLESLLFLYVARQSTDLSLFVACFVGAIMIYI